MLEYIVEEAKFISDVLELPEDFEACKLVEAGFEYVTEMDSFKLFRKRK